MRSTTSKTPRVDPGSLVICGRCRRLRGRVPGRDDGVEQLCRCTPVEVRRAQPAWGGDHNTYAELCRCCGLVLLPSGSRWSGWFCDTCKPLVVALNRASGRCLVPIGRHSLMNGVGARIDELRTRVDVDRLVDNMRQLFGAIGGLEEYARRVVERNLAALGLDGEEDVYVGKYLSTVRRSDLTPQDAFAILVLEILSPREVAS